LLFNNTPKSIKMKSLKTIILLVLLPTLLIAQESELGNWIAVVGNKKLGDKFNWHHEVQHRNYNAFGDTEQFLARTGFGYNLDPNNNLMLGYAYINSNNYSDDTEEKTCVTENRIFQQYTTKQDFGRIQLQHRYRFEERFFNDDTRYRFRYFVGLNMGLNNPSLIDKTLYFTFYNEIFINTENTLFDRNRLYGGLGYKVNNLMRFELAYMNQFFEKSGRDQINVFAFFNW